MFGKTKAPNSVCFRLINHQRNYNAAAIMQQQQRNKVVYGEERVDEEDPKNLFLELVKGIGKATTGGLKASKGLSFSMSGDLKAAATVVVVSKEPNKVEEDPKNLFLKFVKVIGKAITSVLKAYGILKKETNKVVEVVFDEKELDEYSNLFLKIVKVIGICTSGLGLVHDPEPALNLDTITDHDPFNLWCERELGMMRKFGKSVFKLFLGTFFMLFGMHMMVYLDDKVDFDAALDSDSDEDDEG